MEPEQHAADDGRGLPAHAQAGPGEELDAAIAALRAHGAHRVDPGRFAFIEALARRTRMQQGVLRRLLDQRLAQAVAAYGARCDTDAASAADAADATEAADVAAVAEIDKRLPFVIRQHPHAAAELRRLRADGDHKALGRCLARLEAEPAKGRLTELVRLIDGQSSSDRPDGTPMVRLGTAPDTAAPLRELRTVQQFRATWSRLRVDEQLIRSQQQAPENPGPLNSHLLVLRALHRMRDVAPAYLDQWLAHVQALAWIDTAELPKPRTPVASAVRDRRKRKGNSGSK